VKVNGYQDLIVTVLAMIAIIIIAFLIR